MNKIIFLIFAFTSCTFKHTKTTDYNYYYDEEKGIKKIEGKFDGNQESGEWIYYSQDGKIVQQGVYLFGLPIGEWKYSYPDLDTTIIWKEFLVSNISFSLPKSFKQIYRNNDTVNKYFSDTSSKSLFTIRIIDKIDSLFLNNFFNSNLLSFKEVYNVEYSKSDKISIQNQNYYIDDFVLRELSDTSKKISQIILYNKIDLDNKLIVLGITNRTLNKNVDMFFLQEIFYHLKFNNERIVNIYDGFDVRGNVSD